MTKVVITAEPNEPVRVEITRYLSAHDLAPELREYRLAAVDPQADE